MRIFDAKCNISIPLGRLGENEYTSVRFDVSKWLSEMPTAVIALYNQRPQDAEAYPVDGISVRDGIVTWTVTSAELTQVGKGRCELVAIENEVVAKSAIYDTVIFDALGGNGEAPEPWVSWQQTFAQMKADAEAAAQSAEEAVEHYPRITEGIWQVWDVQTGAWVSTGVHAQGEKGDKGYDALCVYLENPTVAIPCDADGLTKPLNQIVAVGYAAFHGGKRIAASSEFAGYTYMNPKQVLPYEIYGFEISPATATSSGVIGFRITEGVNPFGVVEAEIANPSIGITVEGSTMGLPLQFVRVRDGEDAEIPTDRIATLDGTPLAGGTVLEAVGIPEYIKDVSGYSDYGLTESGWYIFARIAAKDGVTVTASTSVTGAAGVKQSIGATYIDVAVRFGVAAESQCVTVNWGNYSETFVFKATDLAVRNLDYRTTFYVYDLAEFVTWQYALTTDATFVADKQYYTKDGDVYTLATVTAGEAVPENTYYNHSKIIISGMTRNITYRLDALIDCPSEVILPAIEDDTHGCWFEFQLRHSGKYSMTLTPPEGVKIATEHTQAEDKGFNLIDLHYMNIDGVRMWRFMNTHSSIPT